MSKHTPGPWYVKKWPGGDSDQSIYARTSKYKNPKFIARVFGEGVLCKDTEKTDANARLIAAAPELLGALRWAMAHVENVFALAGPHDRELPELQAARAAIAKAEGRE